MKYYRINTSLISCIIVILIIYGCGGNKITRQGKEIQTHFQPLVVEKSGSAKRPAWTYENSFFKDKEGFHFIGGIMGGADYMLTLRLAKSEAIKNLLESIEITATSEFSSALEGKNRSESDIGRYVLDAVAWTIENLRVSGITQRQVYYEHVFDPGSHTFKYNAWVELAIPHSDYVEAKKIAAERLLATSTLENDAEAKQKALELLEQLNQET